ncbi:MAG: methyltransferase domain-containing protein [Bacteroidaceae bacterium]|nr:methyltransferase domain-containing protein [Bacteroidaceae bacterium]
MRTTEGYKKLSKGEFTRAADRYETDHAGVYAICRKDYPDILTEIEKESFTDLLDAGCGTAPMLSLLTERFPDAHFTGIDITPKMIEVAKEKHLPNTTLVCADCENMPFEQESFDVIICSQSFHHYPNPDNFFASVWRCLRPNGRLILRDMTMPCRSLHWFVNNIELPFLNLLGYGDVHVYNRRELQALCDQTGLVLESFERRKGLKLHAVIRKVGNKLPIK